MHVPTLFIIILWTTVVMAVSIAIVGRKKHPGLKAWAWALGLQVVGYGFLVLRSHMPATVSIVLGNAAFCASMSLYCFGLYRFASLRPNRLALYLPVLLMMLVSLVWIDDLHTRVLAHSALYAVQTGFFLVLLKSCHSPATARGVLIVSLGVSLFMLMMLFRLVALATGWMTIAAYNESNTIQIVTYLASLTSTMMLSVGILMMTQERAEARLATSERHYHQLVDAATDGICIVQGGILRYANPRMHQLFGYAPDTLPGTQIQVMVYPDDWATVQQNHQQRLAGQGDELRYAARMNTLHTGVRWFEISGVRIDWQGQVATLNFFADITQRRELDETIKNLAYHDTLTQLPNRRLLLDRLDQTQTSTKRNSNWAGLVFLDLDRFKILNDTHGHQAGDLLLVEVARRLVSCVRGIDTVARLGGDEFVVLLSDLGGTEDQAQHAMHHVTEKMLITLAQPYELTWQEGDATLAASHQCSASAGLVLFTGNTSAAHTLLEQADAAMYAAKIAGRNQLKMYTPDTPAVH
jgi:diguanylate cyclase (GGDEF)-like protein/PAS domain S-box-containing protein